ANGASTVSCISDVVVPVPPAVNDNCGNPITPVGPTTGGNYTSCEGTRTYTWVYTDCDGNTHDWVYTYTIDNNTAPTVTSTLTISNPDIEGYTCGSTFTYPAGQSTCIINKSLSHPTWSDDCGSAITTTLSTDNGVALSQVSDVIVGNFPTGTTVIRFTGTDCAGNTGLCTVSVVVQDSQAPTITGCPPSTITTTTDQGQCNKALNLVTPTAGDNCTVASVSYTSTGATQLSGSEFPNQLTFNVGTTVVTYTVRDASGNTTACSYSVTINDNQPITVACPSNQTFGTNTGVCTYTATGAWVAVVTDNCPTQSLNYTLSGATTGTGSNTLSSKVFNKGVTTVTWTAADPGSGTASCSFTITVTDQEAPVVAANGSSTVSCPSAMVAPSVPAAVDNCDGAVNGVLTSTVNTPSFINCEGTRVYTYSYTDAAGNVATWTYTYTLEREDFSMPANQGSTIACISLAFTPPPPSVTDNCGGPIVPTGPVMGGTYTDCEGTRTFTWTYTDCEGNAHPWVFTYTIERNDFTVPANGSSTVACIAQATAPVPPAVTDACGNTLTPTGPVTGGTYTSCEGTRTYTYTYTD
ncbi:MAG: HYR domain-containing protein, partial [Bacteroidota bacterium]